MSRQSHIVGYDLYTCAKQSYRTFIARYGSEADQYESLPEFVGLKNASMAIREAAGRYRKLTRQPTQPKEEPIS